MPVVGLKIVMVTQLLKCYNIPKFGAIPGLKFLMYNFSFKYKFQPGMPFPRCYAAAFFSGLLGHLCFIAVPDVLIGGVNLQSTFSSHPFLVPLAVAFGTFELKLIIMAMSIQMIDLSSGCLEIYILLHCYIR